MSQTTPFGWLIHRTAIDTGMLPANIEAVVLASGMACQVVDWSFSRSVTVMLESPFVLAVGTIPFIKQINKDIKPHSDDQRLFSFFDLNLHYFSKYQHFIAPQQQLNQNGIMLPCSSLLNEQGRSFIKQLFGNKVFLKPDYGLKTYNAEVIEIMNIRPTLFAEMKKYPTDLFWFFPETAIEREVRLLICNKQVIAASQYMAHGEIIEGSVELAELNLSAIEEAISNIEIRDEIYILDLAYQPQKPSPLIIELNAFSTSGWYALEPRVVVKAVNDTIIDLIDSDLI